MIGIVALIRGIVELKLGSIRRRVEEHYRATFTYDPQVVAGIVERCKEVDSGARNIDHILTGTMLPELSAEFLARMAAAQAIKGVHITLSPDGAFLYSIN